MSFNSIEFEVKKKPSIKKKKKKTSIWESLPFKVIFTIFIFLNKVDPYKNYLGSTQDKN